MNDLSTRQEKLMNWLWEYNNPLTSTEMAEKLEPEGWNRVTLLKAVQFLTDNGYLEVVGFEKSAKTYARKLFPAISTVLMNKGINSNSLAEITAAFLGVSKKKKKDKDAQVISKLEEIIAELRMDNEKDM